MLKFLKRLPGRFLRITAVVGVIGMILAAVSTRISPVDVSFLAFFGLSYLAWLIIALIGLLYSIFRKRWFFVILVVITFIGTWDLVSRTFQRRIASEDIVAPKEGNTLNVMSYNVRLFDLYNWTEGSKNT